MPEINIHTLPLVRDPRGNLTFVQQGDLLRYPIASTSWIYDVPGGGRHSGFTASHHHLLIIALSGSFDVEVSSTNYSSRRFTLRRSYQALEIEPGSKWIIEDFSTNSVALLITTDSRISTSAKTESIDNIHGLSDLSQCKLLEIPTIPEVDGRLLADDDSAPGYFTSAVRKPSGRQSEIINHNGSECQFFGVSRVFYLFDVPSAALRGGHSHYADSQLIVAVSGSFTVTVDDGVNHKEYTLNRPDQGLLVPPGIWRELKDFSSGSICLVLTSHPFDEADYVRDYSEFLSLTASKRVDKIPVINLLRENAFFGLDNISQAMQRVAESGRYIGGAEVGNFERALAQDTGVKYAVGVSNGLDALRLIFKAYIKLGILAPGDEVIVPANTYIASILAVSDAGLCPVFCEPDPLTLNLDSLRLEALISQRTRAILVVHLYGRPCWDETIRKCALRHGLIVVEDNAQAIGAQTTVPPVQCSFPVKDSEPLFRTGSLGHAAAFSFYPTKNIGALGDAGAVTTDDSELAECIRALSNYGSRVRYQNIYKGYNCRLDSVQAAVLELKIHGIAGVSELRRVVAAQYDALITNPLVEKPLISSPDFSVWHQYVVRVDNRDEFRAFLAARGISTDIHYPTPPHLQPCYKEYATLPLPLTEEIARRCVSLPISATITAEEIRAVAEAVNAFKSTN